MNSGLLGLLPLGPRYCRCLVESGGVLPVFVIGLTMRKVSIFSRLNHVGAGTTLELRIRRLVLLGGRQLVLVLDLPGDVHGSSLLLGLGVVGVGLGGFALLGSLDFLLLFVSWRNLFSRRRRSGSMLLITDLIVARCADVLLPLILGCLLPVLLLLLERLLLRLEPLVLGRLLLRALLLELLLFLMALLLVAMELLRVVLSDLLL